MEIVVLGAGGYHPNSHRQTSCFMLPERGIVLDAGSGAYRVEKHLATDGLDLFLTHAHLDHVVGLTYLLGLFKGDDASHLRVHGRAGKIDAVRRHLYAEPLFPVEPNFASHPLDESRFDESTGDGGSFDLDGGGRVTWFPLRHPGGSIGYRFDGLDPRSPDRSFAYVTDTVATPGADYVRHIAGVDLMLHEAYFEDDRRDFAELTGHSCVGDVARVASEAGVGRVVLTHMNPRVDEREPFDLADARKVFPEIEFGQDNMVIEL